MDIFLAGLIWVVIGLWARHHKRFKAGKEHRPFFSFGKKPAPVAQQMVTLRPPQPRAPVQAPSGINMVGGKVVYRKAPTPPPAPPPPTPVVKVSPPPTPVVKVSPPPTPVVKVSPLPTPVVKAPPPTPPPAPSILSLPKSSNVRPRSLNIPVALLIKMDRYTYNRETSERLVRQAAECNPGKSGQWCAEKALWDLERDRH